MINLILAVDGNGCIGKNNGLCWNLKKDLNFFSTKTKNQVVIMGKNTYLSLPRQFRPLPERINIVVSSTLKDNNILICSSLEKAILKAKEFGKEIFLIGGKSVYETGIDFADKIYLTKVYQKFDCDICLSDSFYKKILLNFDLENQSEIFDEQNIYFRFLVYSKGKK